MSSVTVSTDALQRATAAAKNIVLNRTTIPLLQCVVMQAEGGVLKLRASNLDSGIEAAMPCAGEGSWAINFNRLSAFMSSLRKGGQVTISGDQIAQLRCGATTARIATLPAYDFPDLLSVEKPETPPHFSTGSFAAVFIRIASVCEKTLVTPYMGGVRVRFNGVNGTLAAMQKVCMARQALVADVPCHIDLMVPAEAGPVIASVFTGKTWIGSSGTTFWATNGDITYFTKTIDASQPVDLDLIQAAEVDFNALDSDTFSAALMSAKSASANETARVILHLKPRECFVAGAESGQVLCIPIDAECNAEVVAAIGADQFKYILHANGSETVSFALVPSNGMLKMPHFEIVGNGFFGVVMPMLSNDSEIENVVEAFRHGSRAPEEIAA